jgi:glycosyltransferase involved in cell wall biosynthesis
VNPTILFVINNLDRGGYEMRLLDLVRYCRNKMDIHICVTTSHATLLPEFEKYNANILFVPVNKAYLEYGQAFKIYDYARKNNIKIVTTYDLKGLLIALFVKLLSLGKIMIVHNTVDLLHSYKFRHKILLKCLLTFVDKSLCNSASTKAVLMQGFMDENKIHVINNGVDVDNFRKNDMTKQTLRNKLAINSNDTVIGTVANFREEKNYPFLFDAFEKIVNRRQNLKLVCVGEGKLFETTKAMAREMNLDGNMIFTGYVQNVHDYMGIMDIFVLCSKKEGFPNALIQAMSMELPVVAANVGGCAEIVDTGVDGYLYESGNTDEFIEKVLKLIDGKDASVEMTSKARSKITSHYTLPVMLDNYVGFYSGLCCR